MELENKTIFLIDGSNFLFRAFYSIKELNTAAGVPVNAVFVFCRMIRKVINDFNPAYLGIIWDGGTSGRDKIFPGYKASRLSAPADLENQKKLILNFLKTIRLTFLSIKGIEADDVLASLAKKFSRVGRRVVIITSDKDLYQIINQNILIYDPLKKLFIDCKFLKEKLRIPANKINFYYSLVGDSTDNIPGVKYIGAKRALKLTNSFANLYELYKNLEKIKNKKIVQFLKKGEKNAFLSQKLFELQIFPIDLSIDTFKFESKNWDKAYNFFKKLNFNTLLAVSKNESISKKRDIKEILYEQELISLCERIAITKEFAFTIDLDGVKPLRDNILGFSISLGNNSLYYIPIKKIFFTFKFLLEKFGAILLSRKIKKICYDSKFSRLIFSRYGYDIKAIAFEIISAAELVVENSDRLDLNYLSQSFDERFIGDKALQVFRLRDILKIELKRKKVFALYKKIEFPLSNVLFMMERTGIYIDKKYLKNIGIRINQHIISIHAKLSKFVGESININSTKQVSNLLFKCLKLPILKKTRKLKSSSTSKEVLEELSKMHPVPKLILEYRSLYKLKKNYIELLPRYINPKTGRIHSIFTRSNIGILNSKPNLQNIPSDSFEVRKVFRAAKGFIFIGVRYLHLELRILAHLSKEDNLKKIFLSGRNVYAEIASKLLNTHSDQLTEFQINLGRRVTYAVIHGITSYRLAKDLGISFKESAVYIEKYFKLYPNINQWINKLIKYVERHGYIKNYFGRRKYISGINEKNKILIKHAKRIAVTTMIESVASDIIKLSMIKLEKNLKKKQLDAKMILQVKNELLLTAPKSQLNSTVNALNSIFKNIVNWDFPLAIDIRMAEDWGSL